MATAATPWGKATRVEEVSVPQRAGEKRFTTRVELLETPTGERLVRFTLETLGDERTRSDLVALFQAGASAGKAAGSLKAYFESSVIDKVVTSLGVPDARMRVALISSYLVGIAINRYVLRLEPLASAREDDVVRLVAPTIQDLLDPSKPLPGQRRKPKGPTA